MSAFRFAVPLFTQQTWIKHLLHAGYTSGKKRGKKFPALWNLHARSKKYLFKLVNLHFALFNKPFDIFIFY